MKIGLGTKPLHEATLIIQELFSDSKSALAEGGEIAALLRDAQARLPGADAKVRELIAAAMRRYGLSVEGMSVEEAAWEIYEYAWGLGPVEALYRDPEVDEIRVNRYDKVTYQRRGRNYKADVRFRDDEHVMKVIARMLVHDRAVLSRSNPVVESRLLDGSRLTAFCPPFVPSPGFVLRKHGTFEATAENYVASGTMDEYTARLLALLARGRANILISGGTNTGKTTLLRWLVSYVHPALRIVTLETDFELYLEKWYPDRDIVSLEEHADLGLDMRRAFTSILRLSPDVIIVGEARGRGEASQMIEACLRGHDGSMGTVHTGGVRDAVVTLAQMALQEGLALPIDLLVDRAARAFDVVVQMYGNNVTGVKKVVEVAEVEPGRNGPEFRPLVVWEPSRESYETGAWIHPNPLSDRLAAKLFRHGVIPAEAGVALR